VNTGGGLTPVTLAKVFLRGVDKRTLVHLFMAFNLELNKSDYSQPGSDFERFEGAIAPMRQDWGGAICVSLLWTHRRICFARAMDPQ